MRADDLRRRVQSTILQSILADKLSVDWLNLFIHDRDVLPTSLSYKNIPLHIFAHIGIQAPVIASPMALCVLFKKRTMFQIYFEHHATQEQAHIKSLKTLWSLIMSCSDAIDQFLHRSITGSPKYTQFIQMLCVRLQWLLRPHLKSFQRIHEQLVCADPEFTYKLCHNDLYCHRSPLLLNLSKRVLQNINPTHKVFSAENATIQAMYYRRVFTTIMNMSTPDKMIRKFCATEIGHSFLFSTIHHHLHPFMRALHTRSKKPQNSTTFKRVITGQVWYVPSTITPYENNVLNFFTDDFHFQTVVNPTQQGPWFFFKAGSYHPRFCSLLPDKFKGCVHRLKYSQLRITSDGVAVPCSLFPELKVYSKHVIDVTLMFPSLRRFVKRRTTRKRMPRFPPFHNRSTLKAQDWSFFARHYDTHAQDLKRRNVFISVAFGLGHIGITTVDGLAISDMFTDFFERRSIETTTSKDYQSLLHQLSSLDITMIRPTLGGYILRHKFYTRPLQGLYKAYTCDNPEILTTYIRICQTEKVIFAEDSELAPFRIYALLNAERIPARIKRLLLHFCVNHGLSLRAQPRNITGHTERPNLNTPLKIAMSMIPAMSHCLRLLFDRQTMTFCSAHALLAFADSHTPCHHRMFTLQFKNENGVGQSVYEEFLRLAWQNATQKRLMRVCEASGSITFSYADSATMEDPTLYAYILGFITAICLKRGLFLPFVLESTVWTYLKSDIDAVDDCFTSGQTYFETHCKDMSVDMFNQTFDTSFTAHSECQRYIHKTYSPTKEVVQMFHAGFNLFWPKSQLQHFTSDELSFMFSAPSSCTELSVEVFMTVFEKRQGKKDKRFIDKLARFSQSQWKRFLSFVTGHDRLPNLDIGESKICFSYDSESEIPRAQNCVNMLILPRDESLWQRSVNIILNYESDFGFA